VSPVQPEIHLLGLSIKTFGLIFALAFVACGVMAQRRLKEIGKPVDWAYEAVFAALVGGVVGARLYYVVDQWHVVRHDLLSGLFGGSGLVFWGGLAGGAAGVVLWAWRRRFLGPALFDLGAPAVALGYAIGRIGCQVSGDGDYGTASNLPWAMAYPDGAVPTDVRVHPTPIYETLVMGLATWWLWRSRDSFRPGLLFPLYLIIAGVERFLVEFIRRNDGVLLGLTAAQLESLAAAAIGVAWIALVRRRDGGLLRADATGRAQPASA